jgi:septal ring factor EnvC (AmiA/AmiB activator)
MEKPGFLNDFLADVDQKLEILRFQVFDQNTPYLQYDLKNRFSELEKSIATVNTRIDRIISALSTIDVTVNEMDDEVADSED